MMQLGLDFATVEELVAGVDEVGRGPLVESGAVAISIRSAFCLRPLYADSSQSAAIAFSTRFANRSSSPRVAVVSGGLPQYLRARATAAAAVSSAGYPPFESASSGSIAAPAASQRPRRVEVSSHRVSSHPETFGG